MRFLLIISFVALFMLPATMAFAALPPLIPMEDFFKNAESAGFSISPDGTRLAFVRPWERRMNV